MRRHALTVRASGLRDLPRKRPFDPGRPEPTGGAEVTARFPIPAITGAVTTQVSALCGAFAFCFAIALSGACAQQSLTGVATVIDGDTIDIHGTRIRLHGIDAPESAQTCERDGKRYRCGQKAALALSDRIGRRPVACRKRGTDRYGRIIAVCRHGVTDLNAWMVRNGWAIAYRRYSRDYIDKEQIARKTNAGIHAGRFIEPSRWRRGHRLRPNAARRQQRPAASCRIKGNISRNGRIYHMPGGQYYSRTRIDERKGERWFCSQTEAQRAGWRRSRR